jgi:dihydroflavonol-4-reductase
MKTALVTGATGFIGSHLAAALISEGFTVRAFHRKDSNALLLKNLPVEHSVGDIRDADAVASAIRGCSLVFHTAALVSFWKNKKAEQLEINIGGTRNVVEACIRTGAASLVHTSSVAALGYRRDGELIDETTAFNWDDRITYKYSKHRAELEVLDGVARGLDAKIVNPTVVIGPGDARMHGGQIVADIGRGHIPAYVAGGMNIVGVQDVVRGHLAAARRGKTGERYIIGGYNVTHEEAFNLVAQVLDRPGPSFMAPVWSVKALARVCDVYGTVTGKEPWITSELISGVGMNNWYSIEKARKELGYEPSPIEPTIRETYEWYEQHGML